MVRKSILVIAALIVVLLTATSFVGVKSSGLKSTSAQIENQDEINSIRAPTVTSDPDIFNESTIGEPLTLDPAIDYETMGGNVIENVYETLVWYDGATLNLVPRLATAVPTSSNGGISANGQFYNFTIRSNVRFHDNSTLTVDDVVFSARRVLTMHDPTGPAWMLQQVLDDYLGTYEGQTVSQYLAQSYDAPWIHNYLLSQPGGLNHVITAADTAAVSALAVWKASPTDVTFRLTHPYAGFLAITAFDVMAILSKPYVLSNPDLNTTAMGTGPYRLVSWDLGVAVHLTRWSEYWGTPAHIRDVNILVTNDVYARIDMLKSGVADYAYVPIGMEANVSGDPSITIYNGSPSLSLTFLTFNYWVDSNTANTVYGGTITDDFFQDIHMRRAFASLLDYDSYISNIYHGNAVQANGPIPIGLMGYNASTPRHQLDLTLAANELKLTYNPGTGTSWFESGFTIPLFHNAGNVARQTASMLIMAALEAISTFPGAGSMTATINTLDWPEYLSQMMTQHGYMPLYSLGWSPDYADPDDYANPIMWSLGMYPSNSCYNNSTIDSLVVQGALEVNLTIRAKIYQDLQTRAYEDVSYIWLTQACNFNVFRSWIGGFSYNPMYGGLYYAYLTKNSVNTPPVASFTVTPLTGYTWTMFFFNASASSDAEDNSSVLTVIWNWDNDTVWDTSPTTVKTATHNFSSAGTHTVNLKVTDSGGLNSTASRSIVVTVVVPELDGLTLPLVLVGTALSVAIALRYRRKED